MTHLRTEELLAGLARVGDSPSDSGTLDLIVRRPSAGGREVIDVAQLDPRLGLVGDKWSIEVGRDADPEAETQLTLMNSRFVALIAQEKSRWPLAGDQLFVDFDLGRANIPPGTRLQLGAAVVEVSAEPHTGCSKFVARFGVDAMTLVNSPLGRERQLRGVNARVVHGGVIRTGDLVRRITS